MTHREAAVEVGSSRRTIRRWVHEGRNNEDPDLCIREKRVDRISLIRIDDVKRVKRIKDKYRDAPTFGRE